MKLALYNEIVENFRRFKGLSRDAARMLIEKYPDVSPDSIHGIVSSETLLNIKNHRRKLHSLRCNWLKQYRKAVRRPGTAPGVILKLSIEHQLSPTLLARVILERYLLEREPGMNKAEVCRYLRDTTLIEDPRLAHEVYMTTLFDDRNGFISNGFCRSIGLEYEIILENHLRERNISYLAENTLRELGYDKTPDIKLHLPIAVNGVIINWIESKARFGSPAVHEAHENTQYFSYWNRFGKGLVIYWFGFVEELMDPEDKRFIVMDHFPENVVCMNPLLGVKGLENDDD